MFQIIMLSVFNSARGGDWCKPIFNWYTQVVYYSLAAYTLTNDWHIAAIVACQWIFLWVTGTGGLHQAFTTKNNAKEFKPFDYIARKLADLTWKKGRYNNVWGVWYGTLVGIVMGIPLLGLLCKCTKYWNDDGKGWRRTEFLIALYYWISFTLLVL